MSRITKVKVMGTDGNFSNPIPIGGDATNIKLENGITVEQALGTVDTSKGTVAQQLESIRVNISTNYYNKNSTDSLLDEKQENLVSAQNIKTLSGESLLGSGDINLPIIKVQSTQPAAQSGRTIIWIDTSS